MKALLQLRRGLVEYKGQLEQQLNSCDKPVDDSIKYHRLSAKLNALSVVFADIDSLLQEQSHTAANTRDSLQANINEIKALGL